MILSFPERMLQTPCKFLSLNIGLILQTDLPVGKLFRSSGLFLMVLISKSLLLRSWVMIFFASTSRMNTGRMSTKAQQSLRFGK